MFAGQSLLLLLALSPAADTVAIGDRVPAIPLKDAHYLARSWDNLPKSAATVIIFLDTGCPVAKQYLPVLRDMEVKYRSKNVQFLGVCVGDTESLTALAAMALRHRLEFPILRDSDGSFARALGVTKTPEAVVLDGERRLRYRGHIDDQHKPGAARAEATRRDLADAIEAVFAGREVATPTTIVDGCPITFPDGTVERKNVTFAEQAAPILRKHCQECHRPGAMGPFPLVTFEQIKGRAMAIADVIADGRMPPWHAAPEFKFANHRGLSNEERETVLAWLHSSRERGDPAKEPPPLPAAPEWRIGKPDFITTTQTFDIPETGDVAYQYAVLPTTFLADTWIANLEIKSDNPRVLHHANLAHVRLTDKFSVDNFITGQVPGGEPMNLPPGVAFKIPAASLLVLQIHFVTTGQAEKCAISVGINYPRENIQQQLHHLMMVDTRYTIPPGAPFYPVADTRTLKHDADAVGLFVHMHLRGKDVTFKAKTPDGKFDTLLEVPNYNFAWQQPYRFASGSKKLPKGTKIECLAHYDNSAFNPFNPNPLATVRDGPQTYHEMLNGFFFYVDPNEKLNLSADPKSGRELRK